jgi:hypothetical protein
MRKYLLLLLCLSMAAVSACTSKKDRLTADTLVISIDPSSVSVSTGAAKNLTAICKSAKLNNVDITPAWTVDSGLGTFNPTSGKTTTFTAGTAVGTGKIYATYSGVIGSVNVTVTSTTVSGSSAGSNSYVAIRNVKYIGGGPDKTIYAWTNPGGGLASGYDMSVADSLGLSNWLTETGGIMEMYYPTSPTWGAIFISSGTGALVGSRAFDDLSAYTSISFEVQGKSGGERLWVGIKDKNQLDDGTETKIQVAGITTSWQTKTYTLTSFTGCDLTKIYIPAEFVFDHH